jgi:PleD family two-component response regulator
VVLRRGDRAAVERTADRIVRTVAESAAACDLGPVAGAVSASIGVALFADLTPRERTERDALVRADEALYAAKRGGRGRHLRYTPELARRA